MYYNRGLGIYTPRLVGHDLSWNEHSLVPSSFCCARFSTSFLRSLTIFFSGTISLASSIRYFGGVLQAALRLTPRRLGLADMDVFVELPNQ